MLYVPGINHLITTTHLMVEETSIWNTAQSTKMQVTVLRKAAHMHITDQMTTRVNTTQKYCGFFLISTRTTLVAFAEKEWVLESAALSLLHSDTAATLLKVPNPQWVFYKLHSAVEQRRVLQGELYCTAFCSTCLSWYSSLR